jgi:hypothetical protein
MGAFRWFRALGGDAMAGSRRCARFASLARIGAVLACLSPPAATQAVVDLLARPGDHLGSTVFPAGDFDADGTPDVLVGADQTYGRNRATFVGGGVGILSGANGEMLWAVSGNDYAALAGVAPPFKFGAQCAMVGDFDRDGTCDVLVVHGNPKVLRKIVAFSGRTRGILWEISDPYRRTDFGDIIVRLGDLIDPAGNLVADGFPDFAVAAPSNPISIPPPSYPGLVRIYSGATPAAGPVVTLVGRSALAAFGSSMTVVGDLDGDGLPGLAIGAPGGRYVEFFDGPSFVSWAVFNSPLPPTAGFGSALANLGDLDGNGTTELAIGAPGAQQGNGRVLVYSLDPRGPIQVVRIESDRTTPGSGFGSAVARLPVDPMTGRGLLDLDHDGTPDRFFDWNHDSKPDYLIGSSGFDNFFGGTAGAGAVFLVRGTGSGFETVREPIHQGADDAFFYAYLPARVPGPGDGFGSRVTILGNPAGESQARIAIGTPRDEGFRGSLTVLRAPLLRFDDDTFSLANDGVGTSRALLVDFGPSRAGRSFQILGTAAGANPGQLVQGLLVPLNDDGPGGLWRHTLAGAPGGTPLGFSQLSGVLDSSGRATITLTVTGTTTGHPWFSTIRQHYLVALRKPNQPGSFAQWSAPVYLTIL